MRWTDRRQARQVGVAIAAALAVAVVALPAEAKKRGGGGSHGASEGGRGVTIVPTPRIVNTSEGEVQALEAGENAAEAMAGAAANGAGDAGGAKAGPGAMAAGTGSAAGSTAETGIKAAAGGDSGSGAVRQTAYGQKGSMARPGALELGATLPVPTTMSVVCIAGCKGAPGQAVLDAPIDPVVHVALQSAEAVKAANETSTLVCMGGCYGAPTQIAGVPGASVGRDGTVLLARGDGKTLKAKQSGAWMVRINRERTDDTVTTPAAPDAPQPGAASQTN